MAVPSTNDNPRLRRRNIRFGILALVLLAAGLAAYFYFSRGTASKEWELARQALDRQDLAAAGEHLRRYLEDRPTSEEGQFLLARTLRRDGKHDEAERHLAEARRLGWDPASVRKEEALAQLQRRDVREKPGDFLASLVSGPSPEKELLEALYRGDLALRSWDRAGLWLHIWLGSYPDDWAPRLWQAQLLERFKKYDRARADYLKVLELQPEHPEALLGVGMCALANRGDYAEAEAYLTSYLAHNAGHAEANLGLARCLYGRGDIAAARAKTLEVLARDSHHAGAALLQGTIEAEAGRDEEAAR